jgi:hypothetical protein
MKTTKKLKTIALSLGLAAAMLPVANVSAQGVFGDMLDNYYAEKEAQSSQGGGALLRGSETRSGNSFSISTGGFGSDGSGTGDSGFGIGIGLIGSEPPAPLGSGLFIMAAAGAAYAFSKKRKKQENN